MERLRELHREGNGGPPGGGPPGGSSPGGGPLNSGPPTFKRPRRKYSFSERSWSDYFSERKFVEVGDKSFCTYSAGEGPIILCLHGGGHSALSWAAFTAELIKRCHVQVLAVDQRGHGDTTTPDDTDLSADTLTDDIVQLWNTYYPRDEDKPPVVLLGHSMGGAVAIRLSGLHLLPNIAGLVVIDVVEGSALDALSSMQGFLTRRPKYFVTVDKAIEWAMKSGQIRNCESARVSMRGQLRKLRPGEAAPSGRPPDMSLQEEDEYPSGYSEENNVEITEEEGSSGYVWQVDLSASEVHWRGWFSGMSKMFLAGQAPKLLLLAGPDRLDTELTLAHMQGKYQLQMFNHSGHNVHEDLPELVSDTITNFIVRQKLGNPCPP